MNFPFGRPAAVHCPGCIGLVAAVYWMLTLLLPGPAKAESFGLAFSVQDGQRLPDDVIDRIGEEVMQGHDFRSVRRRVLEQIPESDVDKGFLQGALKWMGDLLGSVFRRIGDFFDWLFSGLRSPRAPGAAATPPPAADWSWGDFNLPQLLTVIMIVVIILILIVIIAMIVKSIDAKKRRSDGLLSDSADLLSDVSVPPGELAAWTYETRATALAAEGNFRGAIRELLLGSMSWIERAGLIRYRKGLTNRDYLRSVWRRMDKRRAYLVTATQFEYVFFGRRVPTAETFEKCLESFREAFREEETPTAAV